MNKSNKGRSSHIAPDRTFPSSLVIDTPLMKMRSKTEPVKQAVFVVNTDEKELLTPLKK